MAACGILWWGRPGGGLAEEVIGYHTADGHHRHRMLTLQPGAVKGNLEPAASVARPILDNNNSCCCLGLSCPTIFPIEGQTRKTHNGLQESVRRPPRGRGFRPAV